MRSYNPRFLLLCGAMFATAPCLAARADTPLEALAQAHYQAEWAFNPVTATQTGIHSGDGRLNDVSLAGFAARDARLHRERDSLRALLAGKTLSPRERDEAETLDGEIARILITDERIQPQRHDPDFYVSSLTSALYSLIERDFAPLDRRMDAAIARERAMPAMLDQARTQLTTVPAEFRDIAREDLAGSFSFVTHDVHAAFRGVDDPKRQQALAEASRNVVAALHRFQDDLDAVKPSGSFVLGRDTMQAMLSADLVDVPIETVVAAGRAQLARDHANFLAAEKQVDPTAPDQALSVVRADHPAADRLIATAQSQLDGLQQFVMAHALVTLPSHTLPRVIETPPFGRSLITAAMDWPGALEHSTRPGAQTAFYNVTPPDPSAPAAEQREALEDLNRPLLLNITVHEAMPGHFVQSLYLHHNPGWSLIRKLASSYATTEGWAHYSEQMMVEQGLRDHDPKLHLMQLQDALLRDCRLLAAFGMHAEGMSLADATAMMRTQCFQSGAAAAKEARRGTEDPEYYAYTLGKLMILHLRDDQQRTEGPTFSLQRFHDALLGAGLVPMRIIRREMTGQDAPLL